MVGLSEKVRMIWVVEKLQPWGHYSLYVSLGLLVL